MSKEAAEKRGPGQPKKEPYGKLTISASVRALKVLAAICAAEKKKKTQVVENAILEYAARRGIKPDE